MFMFILLCVVGAIYALLNVAVFILYTPKIMVRDLWVRQTWYGKIATNVFFAPAWLITAIVLGLFIGVYWLVKVIAVGTMWLIAKTTSHYHKALQGEL